MICPESCSGCSGIGLIYNAVVLD